MEKNKETRFVFLIEEERRAEAENDFPDVEAQDEAEARRAEEARHEAEARRTDEEETDQQETQIRSHGRRQVHIIYWPSESSTFARCCTFVNTRRKPSHATCEDRWRDAVTYTCIE